MPIVHVNGGGQDPAQYLNDEIHRFNADFAGGALGLDELAARLDVKSQEDSQDDIGVFVEGRSGKHYPVFELARRFIEAANNMVGGFVLSPQGEANEQEGPQERHTTQDCQEVPEGQPRDEGQE